MLFYIVSRIINFYTRSVLSINKCGLFITKNPKNSRVHNGYGRIVFLIFASLVRYSVCIKRKPRVCYSFYIFQNTKKKIYIKLDRKHISWFFSKTFKRNTFVYFFVLKFLIHELLLLHNGRSSFYVNLEIRIFFFLRVIIDFLTKRKNKEEKSRQENYVI